MRKLTRSTIIAGQDVCYLLQGTVTIELIGNSNVD